MKFGALAASEYAVVAVPAVALGEQPEEKEHVADPNAQRWESGGKPTNLEFQ
jgi:hypothetical protein